MGNKNLKLTNAIFEITKTVVGLPSKDPIIENENKKEKNINTKLSQARNNRVDLGLNSMAAFANTYDLGDIAKDALKMIYEYYKKNPEKLEEHIAKAKKIGGTLWEIYKKYK